MSNTNNPTGSTLQSAIDSVSGYAQSALGSLTGSTADKAQGQAKQDKAAVENDLSHTVGKIGGTAISGSGGIAQDNPERSEGSWNQTLGAAKETVGGLVGSEQLKRDGREQNAQGQAQEAKGQLSDLGGGIKDRVQGSLGSAAAGLTGDKDAQAQYQAQHDSGKTLQRSAEMDIQKQAE